MEKPKRLSREQQELLNGIAEVEQEMLEVEAGRKTLLSVVVNPNRPLPEETQKAIEQLFQRNP